MRSDLFQEWRAADRMAWAAERAVAAGSLRAIAGTGSLPTQEARAKARNLRATADDIFRVSMDEMSARVNELRR